jgi:hypothetical protein
MNEQEIAMEERTKETSIASSEARIAPAGCAVASIGAGAI